MKNHLMSLLILGLSFSIVSSVYPIFAIADDYPQKEITCIVPFSPGGGSDRAVRILQPILEKELGIKVIIDNRPGAGGVVGVRYVLREKPDGYVFLVFDMPSLAMVAMLKDSGFKYEDLYPILLQYTDTSVLLVKKDSSLNSLTDFIEEAKKNPGKMSLGMVPESNQYVKGMFLKNRLNLNINIVPFKGGSDAATAMLGGHIDVAFGDAYSRYNLREQTKCIGVSAPKSHPLWAEGKPINEQLKKYGVEIPDHLRYQILYVPTEFKRKFPDRYKKLQNALLNVGQNKEYMELEKKQRLDYFKVWEPGEKYEKEFREIYKFVVDNAALMR